MFVRIVCLFLWILTFFRSYTDGYDYGWERVLTAWTGRSGNLLQWIVSRNATLWDYESTPANQHFMSNVFRNWGRENVSQVKVSIIKNDTERAYLIFDAVDSNYMNWFSQSRLFDTSFTLDTTTPLSQFRIRETEYAFYGDTFIIRDSYGSCSSDGGWLMVIQAPEGECPYQGSADLVKILYSPNKTSVDWQNTAQIADRLEIFIARAQTATVETFYTEADVATAAITVGSFTGVMAFCALVYIIYKDCKETCLGKDCKETCLGKDCKETCLRKCDENEIERSPFNYETNSV